MLAKPLSPIFYHLFSNALLHQSEVAPVDLHERKLCNPFNHLPAFVDLGIDSLLQPNAQCLMF